MEKIILTDCDGCLVDWNPSFHVFAMERGYDIVPEQSDNYSIAKRFGISEEEATELAEKFNTSRHIEFLPPHRDAPEYVKLLSELGFEFIVITGFTDNPIARIRREANLLNTFGSVFSELHCMSITDRESKGALLSQWKDSGLYWIEDHPINAMTGVELGLKAILIDQPYNRSTDLATESRLAKRVSVNPWQQIYQHITKEYYRATELP